MRRGAMLIIALAVAVVGSLALGCPAPFGEGATRLRIAVAFDDQTELDQLRITLLQEGALVVPPSFLPESPRALDHAGESVTILFDDGVADQVLTTRVDGLLEQEVVASAGALVGLVVGEEIAVHLTLDDPAVCGDRAKQAWVEECDDGNLEGGDGCTGFCTIEPGFDCLQPGEPCTPL